MSISYYYFLPLGFVDWGEKAHDSTVGVERQEVLGSANFTFVQRRKVDIIAELTEHLELCKTAEL